MSLVFYSKSLQLTDLSIQRKQCVWLLACSSELDNVCCFTMHICQLKQTLDKRCGETGFTHVLTWQKYWCMLTDMHTTVLHLYTYTTSHNAHTQRNACNFICTTYIIYTTCNTRTNQINTWVWLTYALNHTSPGYPPTTSNVTYESTPYSSQWWMKHFDTLLSMQLTKVTTQACTSQHKTVN